MTESKEDKSMNNLKVYVNDVKVENCKIECADGEINITFDEPFDFFEWVDEVGVFHLEDELPDKLGVVFEKCYLDDNYKRNFSFIVENEPWEFSNHYIREKLRIPSENILCSHFNGKWIYTIILEKPDEE